MDKAQIIRWLEDKKQKADTQYADGMNDGLSFAIALIEQMEEEPITAEALEKAGYDRVLVSSYNDEPAQFEYIKTAKNENKTYRLIEAYIVPGVSVYLIEGNKKTKISPQNMSHLRALEEMFLS